MAEDRLARQMAFLAEADRLKGVLRASPVLGGLRRENSAEHSWHLALHALVLADQAGPDVRIDRVIRMLLIHDLVEVDVGDVPIHATNGRIHGSPAVQEAEAAAAVRIFGILPNDLRDDLLALWQEFEAGESPDAIFARSIDRVQPVMLNLWADGGTWAEYAVTWDQLENRVGHRVARGAPRLWDWVAARARAWFGPTA
jgi:putative hydrolases of HD superfamily